MTLLSSPVARSQRLRSLRIDVQDPPKIFIRQIAVRFIPLKSVILRLGGPLRLPKLLVGSNLITGTNFSLVLN